ncbi:TraM recognition domain-containing protein [Robertkochia solimangrovi]|uniref:TraM recognition domain-containing protein n=1 Tax=Robertkochia solimangrovi TaxID=2213046 RepID=UPI0030CD2543
MDFNNPDNPALISLVNNTKYDTAYSPIITMILYTVIKQMSVRNQQSSFLPMEYVHTPKLPYMHRISAILRSYDISTVYVMQDEVQNDRLYGDIASRTILSNLS